MAITTFIPKLWAARLLQAYNRKLVFGALVNRNYEGEIRKHGDTVHINTLDDINVKEYTPNTEIDGPEQLNTEDQTLVIDHGTYYNFYVDDVDKVQAAGDLMTTAMTNAADRLAEDAENYIIGKVLAEGGIKLSGKLSGDTVWAEIVKIKTAMDKANVPLANRNLVVPPSVEGILLLDDRFVKGTKGEDRLENGAVARAAGFSIHVSNAPAMENSMVAFNRDAMTFANQLTETEAYRPEKRFADAVKGLSLCGAKVTRPDAVVVYSVTA
jgi:hypothetical protein